MSGNRVEDGVYDVIIVGAGVAGLMTVLHLPKTYKVLVIAKEGIYDSNSYLAQGGMSVLKDEWDYESYFEDTMHAGHYENNPEAVEWMIKDSRNVLCYLQRIGVPFEKIDGKLNYTREGAHSKARIVHYEDTTGRAIVEKLVDQVVQCKHIHISLNTKMVDWIIEAPNREIPTEERCGEGNRRIKGIVIEKDGAKHLVYSSCVVLATGGIGGTYKNSTNYPHITGDSLALAKQYGVTLKDMDYVQIHPTTLYSTQKGKRFLITEAVRGEGGILLNAEGKRFVDELLPRDLVSKAIYEEMAKFHVDYVELSFEYIAKERIITHFPNIYAQCLKLGYDITIQPIPVVPAQHYFMGGIQVDLEGVTSIDGLYAVGETSCTGVHGKNRLASNSLLEAMVFAKRVAESIKKNKIEVENNEKYWHEKHVG